MNYEIVTYPGFSMVGIETKIPCGNSPKEMGALWNQFFAKYNIKNYWYDTFNHHDYLVNSPVISNFEEYYNQVSGSGWPTWTQYLDKQFDLNSANATDEALKFLVDIFCILV